MTRRAIGSCLACGAAALLLLAGVRWHPRRSEPAAPPEVDLAGVDPHAVAAIEAVRGEVRRAPQSDLTWGRLGMTLLAHNFGEAAYACLARAERLNLTQPRWPFFQ